MNKNGLKFYERGRVSIGVIDTNHLMKSGKFAKHRFDKFDLLETFHNKIQYWETLIQREKEFQKIMQDKGRRIVQKIGMKEDMKDVLEPPQTQRDKEFRNILWLKREKRRNNELRR